MLKIWVVGVEQLELDLIIETLEKHILLLLVGADVDGGIPRQLNELVQVLIHRHIPLIHIGVFIHELEGVVGHVVSSKTSLQLIPGDSLDVGVGVVVSLPPVCYISK
jgi:hypothetical protein